MSVAKAGKISPLDPTAAEPFYRQIYNRFRSAIASGLLKPGGRIAISDVVNLAPLPSELAADEALLCGCIAGAAASGQIERWLTAAGFERIRIAVKPESRELVKTWAPGRGIENYVASATIEARKPMPFAKACRDEPQSS